MQKVTPKNSCLFKSCNSDSTEPILMQEDVPERLGCHDVSLPRPRPTLGAGSHDATPRGTSSGALSSTNRAANDDSAPLGNGSEAMT